MSEYKPRKGAADEKRKANEAHAAAKKAEPMTKKGLVSRLKGFVGLKSSGLDGGWEKDRRA